MNVQIAAVVAGRPERHDSEALITLLFLGVR